MPPVNCRYIFLCNFVYIRINVQIRKRKPAPFGLVLCKVVIEGAPSCRIPISRSLSGRTASGTLRRDYSDSICKKLIDTGDFFKTSIWAHFWLRRKPGFAGVPPLARPLRAPPIPCAVAVSATGGHGLHPSPPRGEHDPFDRHDTLAADLELISF
jgi:hypothetical protein